MARDKSIARSVVRAITANEGAKIRSKSPLAYILALFWALFSLYQLPLHKIRPKVFSDLRQKSWDVEDEEYIASFQPDEGERPENTLNPIGDMGFSGSVCHCSNCRSAYSPWSPADLIFLYRRSTQPRINGIS
jgi:hypothetical protein